MNWVAFALKVPSIITGAMQVVEKVKGAKGPAKSAAVKEAIRDSVVLAELGMDKDLLNDAEVEAAVQAVIDAQVHLKNVLTKKAA